MSRKVVEKRKSNEVDPTLNASPDPKKTRLMRELLSSFTPKMLSPAKVDDGPTSRSGRKIRKSTLLLYSEKTKSNLSARLSLRASPNKRKVRKIFSIHRNKSNPELRFVSVLQSESQPSYIEPKALELINMNKSGKTNRQFQENNTATNLNNTIPMVDLSEDSNTNEKEFDHHSDNASTSNEKQEAHEAQEVDFESMPIHIIKKLLYVDQNDVIDVVDLTSSADSNDAIDDIDMNSCSISLEQSYAAKIPPPQDQTSTSGISSDSNSFNDFTSVDNIDDTLQVGEVVWASIGRSPFWPALISESKDEHTTGFMKG